MPPEVVAAIPFFTLFVVGIVVHFRLISRLRRDHEQLWLNLGKPHPFFNSIATTIRLRRFLREDVQHIDDLGLRRIVLFDRVIGWCYLVAFVVFVAISFQQARSGRRPVFPIQIGGLVCPTADGSTSEAVSRSGRFYG